MSKNKANAAQQQAIETIHCPVIVSAGAGSGKTWVLTQRYMHLLERGERPSSIIAMTFTEKAAAEMKQRIRAALEERLDLEGTGLERQHWEICRQELAGAAITTIHGFCSRLIRQHPLQTGVDPQFAVLEENQSQSLLRQCLEEEFEAWVAEGGEEKRRLYLAWGPQRMVDTALGIYEKMRTHHMEVQHIYASTQRSLEERMARIPDILRQMGELVREGKHLAEELARARSKTPAYLEQLFRFAELWERAQEVLARHRVLTEEVAECLNSLRRHLWRNTGDARIKEVRSLLGEQLKALGELYPAADYMDLVQALLSLIQRLDHRYRQAKKRKSVLDFHDLEEKAWELLGQAPIQERLQRQYRYLMVDEFQDTNPLQMKLVDLLTQQAQAVNLFVVGDPKQSIYRFRGAELEVFQRLWEELPHNGGQQVVMDRNYRTQAPVLHYVNHFFAQGMPTGAVPFHPLLPERQQQGEYSGVEVMLLNPAQWDGPPSLEEARAIARKVQQLVAVCRLSYRDIALLFATKTHFSAYEAAFRELGIPYQVLGGRNFYQQQEIMDVSSLLSLLECPSDELALAAVLRSPFFSWSDEDLYWALGQGERDFWNQDGRDCPPDTRQKLLEARRQLSSWMERYRREPVSRLLSQLLRETGYRQTLLQLPDGKQRLANLEKLCSLLEEVDTSPGEFLRQQCQELVDEEEAPVSDGEQDAVVMMTVHASKGLEFPVVILPRLHQNLLPRFGQEGFVLHPEKGLGLRLRSDDQDWAGDGLYEWLKEGEKRLLLEEEWRKLYVAMTRARDLLVLPLVVDPERNARVKEARNTWQDWIMEHLGLLGTGELKPATWSQGDCRVRITVDEGVGEGEPPQPAEDPIRQRPAVSAEELALIHPLEKVRHRVLFSATALMTYQRCPRQYYWRYVVHLPEEEFFPQSHAVQGTGAQLSGAQRGSLFHTWAEWAAQHPHAADWEQEMERVLAPEAQPDMDTEQWHQELQELKRLWRRYVDSSWHALEREQGRVVQEWPFHLLLGPFQLYGRLDKLVAHEDGRYSIVDLKTNKVRGDLEELVEEYRIQAMLYTLAVEESLGEVRDTVFLFLDAGYEAVMWSRHTEGPKALDSWKEKLHHILEQLSLGTTAQDFPAQPRERVCGFCPYRHYCSEAKLREEMKDVV